MKAQYLYRLFNTEHGEWMPAGFVLDHPKAFMLVRNGCAVAVDEECHQATNRTPEQLEVAQRQYKRLQAGIHPDDFGDYDAGRMVGYDGDGNPIPGPNYVPPDDDIDAEDDFLDMLAERVREKFDE